MKTCESCKNYNKEKEVNCEFYNIIIPDLIVARKCRNFKDKTRRKRCNRCEYMQLRVALSVGDNKYYCCTKRKINLTYTALKHCTSFKKKIE